MKRLRSSLIIALMATTSGAHALACVSEIGGTWGYGSVPSACSVSPQQPQAYALSEYKPVLFLDAQTNSTGRKVYMSQMYPVVRDMGHYYIHRRNPSVSPSEEDGFLQALYALSSQESEWTHYRKGKDGLVRFMRGDSLHGYGLMQIDDRAHPKDIQDGRGVDLIYNMLLGLDQFYAQWVKSTKASCVASSSDYRGRARSAWAAYNGGAGSICRWTNSKSKWAANDIGYRKSYDARNWLTMVENKNISAALNVKCLAEGTRPCSTPQSVLAGR